MNRVEAARKTRETKSLRTLFAYADTCDIYTSIDRSLRRDGGRRVLYYYYYYSVTARETETDYIICI